MRDKNKIVFWIFVVLMSAFIILFICSAKATQIFLSSPPEQLFIHPMQYPSDTIQVKKFEPTIISVFVLAEELEGRDVDVYAYIESYEGYLYYLYNDEWIFARNKFEFEPAVEGILPQWVWNPYWVVYESTDVRSFTVHVCVDDRGYRVCAEKRILVSIW